MDAKITKQRLANLLSYDWLKMLVTVAVVVFLVMLLFLTTATRVTNWQTFTVYAYTDLSAGQHFSSLADDLKDDDVFSYDILETQAEIFSEDSTYDLLSLRRTTGAGTVMFISDVWTYETDEDGNYVDEEGNIVGSAEEAAVAENSALYGLTMSAAATSPDDSTGVVYDTRAYFQMCEDYLVSFFGEDLTDENAAPDEAKVRASFLERNEGDKRYKTEAAREAGIADERSRLLDLKEDYLLVRGLFESGVYTHTVYEGERENGETYEMSLGVNVGNLGRVTDLVYYRDAEGTAVAEQLNLVFFFNNFGEENNGLLFEAVSFLRYLYEEYGA